ncbi:MAG: DNA repair protein RecN [Gammaproteobacteria bacterium]|nr:DNA repair protein RecN [Gammaproteobacteria bacterium]
MLTHLYIRNFALVEALELSFEQGMSVLSGETGAGKSILLDALGLTLGDRADSTVVRHGSERAEISASFTTEQLPTVTAWLEERELVMDGECILRRTVGADGRSRAFINGQPAPLQMLRELGEQLVDIHGQHAHQSLLKREVQRQLLDDYAGHGPLLKQLAQSFQQWQRLGQELAQLQRLAGERDSRLELLRYQVEELEALQLQENELAALDEEHGRLANVSRLQEGAQRAAARLYEEEESAMVTLLDRMLRELQELQGIDGALAPANELLEGAAIQLREAAVEIRHYLDRLDNDPQRLNIVEQRLGAIHELARKHRVEPAQLPPLLEQLQQELAQLEGAGGRLDGLQLKINAALADYRQAAGKLSAGRATAAKTLAQLIGDNMQELGMGGGRFDITLAPIKEIASAHGQESVEFQVSANPGQPLRPLSKVASGGELSRISLAIQVISAGREGIPTLIFDEVDVGIGGGVAERVGRQLRALGQERQVLCVTHQPQVAAQGHHHFRISKQSDSTGTRTTVELIADEQRVTEVARMSGGIDISEQTLSHARAMLATAQQQ